MSQYPSPYTPPSLDPQMFQPYPQATHNQPARRAGLLMMILAGLGLCCGTCIAAMAPVLASSQMPPETMQGLSELESTTGIPIRQLAIIVAIMLALPALLLGICGFWARGGGKGAIYTSIILVGLMSLMACISLLGDTLRTIQRPQYAAGLLVDLIVMATFGLILTWLIQALRAAGQLTQIQQQYQAQYMQYLQQQWHAQWAQAHQNQQPPTPPPGQ